MVQRVIYRRRHCYATKSNKIRKVKTPGTLERKAEGEEREREGASAVRRRRGERRRASVGEWAVSRWAWRARASLAAR
jgi:hypothetical protein